MAVRSCGVREAPHYLKGVRTVKALICQFCGEGTFWPDENEAQMVVYGVMHAAECPSAPCEIRAEAIVTAELMRTEGRVV